MNESSRQEILALGGKAHALTESAYRSHPATRGEAGWEQKQRILLADMAIHLLQTALADGELPAERLRQNLFAILTVSDQFLPACGLKQAARQLSPD